MGIRNLNKFFKENTKTSIYLCNLHELAGKKIVVDISIYLYKFTADNTLIENIYLMLSLFNHYNIIPVFVFDGKPPDEKYSVILKRKEIKKNAEEEYKKLSEILQKKSYSDDYEKQEIINNMDVLKKKFVYINKNDITIVKNLIKYYGFTYYTSQYEADDLCCLLTIKEKVWACLSEDMDMFVYGCPRVIRYLSLLNHTAVIYDLNGILNELGINQTELRQICVLSGTDYNVDNQFELDKSLKYFKKYYKLKNTKSIDFYTWLEEENIINNLDYLKDIYNKFDLEIKYINPTEIENIIVTSGSIMTNEIRNILKEDGFIFPINS